MRAWIPLFTALALAACSGETETQAPEDASAAETQPAASATPAAAEPALDDEFAFVIDGPQIYADFCAGCHMPDGSGIETVNPPLVGSPLVEGDPGPLVHFMLTLEYPDGYPGPTEWSGGMGATAYLSDEELAAVLTYVRETFANGPEVTAADVASVRG
ncbi:MAG: cytochrome c [Maricaulaceae bacterium]|jgi:mono/diheme cytochrome c family protein